MVRVKNESGQSHTVRVAVDFPGARQSLRTVYATPLTLPARSMMDVRLMVRFPSMLAISANSGSGAIKGLPVRVRLMKEEIELVTETFYSIPVSEDGFTVLWAEGEDNEVGFSVKKGSRSGSGLNSSPPGVKAVAEKNMPIHPSAPHLRKEFNVEVAPASKIPHRLMGYDSYDLVFLSSWKVDGLDPLQIDSLLNWVRGGGQLVLIAGEHMLKKPLRELAEVSPIWPAEHYSVSTLPEIEKYWGDLGIADGISIWDGPRASAEILMGNEDQPLVTARRLGNGSVYFFAADPARDHTATLGMVRFFQAVVAAAADRATSPPSFAEGSAKQILEQLVAVRILPRSTMILWLGIYGVLIVSVLVGSRYTKRPEFGYGLVALVACGLFFFLHLRSKPGNNRSDGQVERARAFFAELPMGGSDAAVHGMEGFFPTTQRNARLEFQSFDGTVFPQPGIGAERPEVVEIWTRDQSGIGSWQISPNTLRAANFATLMKLPAGKLHYSARLTRDGLLLEVDSTLPWKLMQPFLKWNRFIYPLPDLVDGHPLKLETWKDTSSWGHYQSSSLQGGASVARGLLRQVVFPDIRRRWESTGNIQNFISLIQGNMGHSIALAGFSSESAPLWKEKDSSTSEAVIGMWMVDGNEAMLAVDPEFYLPPGIAEMELSGKDGRVSYMGGGNFSGGREETISIKFRLPSALRQSVVQELTFHGEFESLHFKPMMEVGFGTAHEPPTQWIPLAWSSEMPFPDPSNSFPEQKDTAWVRIKIVRNESSKPKTNDGSASISQVWSIRGLDLSMKGKLKGIAN